MLGMGSMEILVILLISFLLLGPQKMISGARMLGDLISEAKRFAEKIPHMDVDNSPPLAIAISMNPNLTAIAQKPIWAEM